MTTSNDFSRHYRTISNSELLSIVDNPGDYQPLAVEAAKQELSNRQLSDLEIQAAKEEVLAKRIQKEEEQENIKAVQRKVKATRRTLIDTLNPIQSEILSTERTIRLVVIVFAALFLYQFIKDFNTHLAWVKDIPAFPLGSFWDLSPLVLLSFGTFKFWKRKNIGWVFLIIFLTFSAVGTAWLLIQSFSWKTSGHAGIDNLFPRPPLITYIIQLLFSFGTIYVLCKENIRRVFSVDKQKMIATILITGVVTIILLFLIS